MNNTNNYQKIRTDDVESEEETRFTNLANKTCVIVKFENLRYAVKDGNKSTKY